MIYENRFGCSRRRDSSWVSFISSIILLARQMEILFVGVLLWLPPGGQNSQTPSLVCQILALSDLLYEFICNRIRSFWIESNFCKNNLIILIQPRTACPPTLSLRLKPPAQEKRESAQEVM